MNELIESLITLMNTQSRYNKAVAEFEGYSWDWYGRNIIEELDEAKENAKNLMDKKIDERVKIKIEEYFVKDISIE
jgi:hypothetical protein